MPEDHRSPPTSGPTADPEATFTIDDLTAQAGVTVRTVRYYIGEGLLPPPLGAGPGTRYTREHLDRLLLIGALKDRYLPLREIRRQLQGMDAAAIHESVEDMHRREEERQPEQPERGVTFSMMAPPDASGSEPGSAPGSASSYIDAILHGERDGIERRSRRRPGPQGPRGGIRAPDMFPLPADPGERRWRKLAITPEAELTIEDELYHRRREQIESLIAHIQRVLASS